MFQIRKGLEERLNVSWYAKLDFNWEQMEQIQFGLEYNAGIHYVEAYDDADDIDEK
ncbi:hypothetical protein [Metamycoplasma hyosynoviae]|uniref:hypothetical protein n=1 Tax=Metamycoplasma hyosynoviae TaxID=29559 RepID=UPI000AACF16B|nr:hypothetical protein [Metamycoplasma hyosynoviae]MDC8919464.1 hypothetical protein [Metamycoplasma hyosynoviae]MDD1359909.1 hypothetical protein [Metamycoplasma hyosynoviae]